MAVCGKHRGIVVNNIDPELRGRLQVSVPDVPEASNAFALPSVPYAGQQVGFVAIPPIGANVWVEFEAGDVDFPIWSGCFWAAGEAPTSDVDTKMFKVDGVTMTMGPNGFQLEVGPPAASATMTLSISGRTITLSNGLGASIVLDGPTVSINDGAFVVQ